MHRALPACAGSLALAFAAAARPAAARADGRGDPIEHGAYIYAGSCDRVEGRVRYDIGDLEPEGGADAASPLAGSGPIYEDDEDISATIEELLGSPHAVVVRERDDRSSPVIACGAITGQTQNGRLSVELRPVGGSQVGGVAVFVPNRDDDNDDDDDERTEVLVQVRHGM